MPDFHALLEVAADARLAESRKEHAKKRALVKAHVVACKTKDCPYCEALRKIMETKGFRRRV